MLLFEEAAFVKHRKGLLLSPRGIKAQLLNGYIIESLSSGLPE